VGKCAEKPMVKITHTRIWFAQQKDGTTKPSWSGNIPVPTPGRFPGSLLNTQNRLPDSERISDCPKTKVLYSQLTVTRSHRFHTCFPFTPLLPKRQLTAPDILTRYSF